ncbi:hypothetical protein Tco_0803429 [Tanacetum coccineum]|uniref:Uncharacterized protein n=1 Tax=Tanacetum coccineum TaxID=301880 RepID=A0ABQ5A403_9ASTR
MLVWGEADSDTSPKRSLRRKLFKICCMNWGEVNLTHAYYNGSCIIEDTEDPSWSISFRTRITQKTSSALEVLWKTLFVLYLYLIGTLLWLPPLLTKYLVIVDSKGSHSHHSCNPRGSQHSRTKHKSIELAGLFTKSRSEDRFKYLVRRLGMRCLTSEELEVLVHVGSRKSPTLELV